MRAVLLLFAVLAGGAAAYLSRERGASDVFVLATAAACVFALIVFKATPSARSDSRRSWHPAPVPSAEMREELSELAGNLEALSNGLPVRTDDDLDGPATMATYLSSVGPNQIAVIKVLRNYLDLGLAEAKGMTDAARRGEKPLLSRSISSAQARAMGKDIDQAGGHLEVR